MSKSYAKYKRCGICSGTNTEFYRVRRRKFRKKNKQAVKKAMSSENFDEEFQDFRQPKRDDWREPTDGTFHYTKKVIDQLIVPKSGRRMGLYTTKSGKVKK